MLREKLLSGNLRKHSEQLKKFVSGFFDTDGCVGVALDKGYLKIYSKITQASSKDPDFEVMRALNNHYQLGYVSFYIPGMKNSAGVCDWVMNISDSKKFFNLIGKHLLVKREYFEECIFLYEELKGLKLNQTQYEEIKEYLSCIKSKNTIYRKPKHLSWAYVAGLLCGDGHFRCKLSKTNELEVELYSTCRPLLEQIVKCFKGTIREKRKDYFKWRRSLGKGSHQFAIWFLPKIRKYSLLETKRSVMNRMLVFHKLPAETKYGEGVNDSILCNSPSVFDTFA